MGLFGGGRKAAERAEEEERERQRNAAKAAVEESSQGWQEHIDDWMKTVEEQRPAGASALTDEVLAITGPCPMPQIPAEYARSGQGIMMSSQARSYATETARRQGVKVGADGNVDLARYWESVSHYLSGT